jgi:hypothetical protein
MGKFEDLLSSIGQLGDTIRDVFSTDELKEVSKCVDMDFYKLRNEITSIARFAQRSGYSNLAAAQVVINAKEKKDEYRVDVNLYYSTSDEQVQKVGKNYEIYGFSYIPAAIKNTLEKDGTVMLTFSKEEITEIIQNMDLNVYDSRNQPFSHWVDKESKLFGKTETDHLRVKLYDMAIYYRAMLYLVSNEGVEKYLSEFLTAQLVGINNSNMEELSKTGNTVIDL